MKTQEENATVLLEWLRILNAGYIKPDINRGGSNATGTVRDTKKYFKYIDGINEKLSLITNINVKEDEHTDS